MDYVEFDEIDTLFSMEVVNDVLFMVETTDLTILDCFYNAISVGLMVCFDIPEKETYGETYNDLMDLIYSDMYDDLDDIYWAGIEYICENY